MYKTKNKSVFTNDKQEANATALFEELVEVITDTFIATYQKEGTSLIMQFVNGQKYRVTVRAETSP